MTPVDTGHKLNVHKTFRRRRTSYVLSVYVLCLLGPWRLHEDSLAHISREWIGFLSKYSNELNCEKSLPCFIFLIFELSSRNSASANFSSDENFLGNTFPAKMDNIKLRFHIFTSERRNIILINEFLTKHRRDKFLIFESFLNLSKKTCQNKLENLLIPNLDLSEKIGKVVIK